jgi:hypothetical protein
MLFVGEVNSLSWNPEAVFTPTPILAGVNIDDNKARLYFKSGFICFEKALFGLNFSQNHSPLNRFNYVPYGQSTGYLGALTHNILRPILIKTS